MPINVDWNATAYFPPQEPDRPEITSRQRDEMADELFASIDKTLKRRGVSMAPGSVHEARVMELVFGILAMVTTIQRHGGA